MRVACALSIGLVSLLHATPPVHAQSAASSVGVYLPENAYGVVVLRDGDRRLPDLRELLRESGFADSPLNQRLLENRELTQARVMLNGVAATAGVDAWQAIGALLGRELAVAVSPGANEKPALLVVSVLRDADLADRLLAIVYSMIGLTADGEARDETSRVVDGVRVFKLGNDGLMCRVDDALVLTNDREVLRAVLALRAEHGPGLGASSDWREASAAVPNDAAVWGFVRLKSLRERIAARRAVPDKLGNPLAGFLFGGWQHGALHAEHAVLWARADAEGLAIDARIFGAIPLPDTHRGFAIARTKQIEWDAAELPRYLGELQLGRDWSRLFADREALLTLPAAGQVVNFSTTLTNLFGGMDFINDMLPKLGGPTRLVIARQDFSASEILPVPKLPAFALVTPIQPDAIADMPQRLFSAAQMAMSILNLDMAQKGLPTYMIDMDRYRDVRMLTTIFTDPAGMSGMAAHADTDADGEVADTEGPREAGVRYNFAPAVAVVEGQYVIATSKQLLTDIIDAIFANKSVDEDRDDASTALDRLTIDGPSFVEILRANQREFIANRMLEEDQSKAAAERDIQTILELLGYVQRLTLTTQHDADGPRASLELKLRFSELVAP